MVAATRILHIAAESGAIDVPVIVTVPVEESDAVWRCDFEIGWPGNPAKHHGMGVDSVQALESALKMIAIHLYASPTTTPAPSISTNPAAAMAFLCRRAAVIWP
jgi:hypothetical protein